MKNSNILFINTINRTIVIVLFFLLYIIFSCSKNGGKKTGQVPNKKETQQLIAEASSPSISKSITAIVKTTKGIETVLSNVRTEIDEKRYYDGIRLNNGVVARFEYIRSIIINSTNKKGSCSASVYIVFVDKTPLSYDFELACGCKIMGTADVGEFEMPLDDIKQILIEGNSDLRILPSVPPQSQNGMHNAIIIDRQGRTVSVSDFVFRYYLYSTFWNPPKIENDIYDYVKIESGFTINFDKISKIVFGPTVKSLRSVLIELKNGKSIKDTLHPEWYPDIQEENVIHPLFAEGNATLGLYTVNVSNIKSILFK